MTALLGGASAGPPAPGRRLTEGGAVVAITDDVGRPPAEFERQPPQDIAAEQSVLGGMLLSKDAIADVVEVLRSGDFYRPAHQMIYDTILNLYGRGEPADPVAVSAELTRSGQLMRVGGAPYLHTLISSVPTAANAGYYAQIVAERAVLRRLVEAGTRIVHLGYGAAGGQGGDIDEVVDRAQAAIYDVTEHRMSEDYVRLEQLLQGTMDEIDAISSRGGASIGVPTGFSELDQITNGLHGGQMIIIAARPAIGKALALDTPLPTPTGWTTMGEVRVGDALLGADGRPTRVVAATEVMHGRPCYQVEFSDGTVVVSDALHQWLTTTRTVPAPACPARAGVRSGARSVARFGRVAPSSRLAGSACRVGLVGALAGPGGLGTTRHAGTGLVGERGRPGPDGDERTGVLTTAELAASLRRSPGGWRRTHSVPVARPLDLPEQQLPVPPYPLGVWVGRAIRAGRAEPPGDGTRVVPRETGTPGDRHISPQYLRASEAQRRALLAGLLDGAGHGSATGTDRLAVTDQQLAEQVHELVLTLGLRATMRTERRPTAPEAAPCHVISFASPDRVHPPGGGPVRTGWTDGARRIVAVRPVASVPVRCVEVDNPDHLYLASRSMIPTHNSTLGLDFARSCSIRHGLTSVIFSLEMSRSEITMKLLAAEAKVPLHHMRSGHMSDEDWARLARRMGEVADAPLYIDDSPNLTMMEIRAKARRLKQRHDLRLIVVDYMQLLTSGKRVESRQQEVSEFSRSLKLLAKELEVPVIAISQLNRGPEQRNDKKPMLADLRESGCMVRDTTLLRADTGAPVTFGELLDNGHEGVLLWSLDTDRRLVAAPVTNVFPSGVKETYRLRLASGREVVASGNHRFRTLAGWVRLDDLSAGDRIAVPRRIPPPVGAGLGWSEYRLGLLAHLIGAGRVLPGRPVHYTSTDQENLRFVEDAARVEFGVTPRRVRQGGGWRVYLPTPRRHTSESGNPLHEWLAGLDAGRPGGQHTGQRTGLPGLPGLVHSAADGELAVFLRHLWATGGVVSEPADPGGGLPTIRYRSASRRLVDGIALLLSRFGIMARIARVRDGSAGARWQLVVSDPQDVRTFCARVGLPRAAGGTPVAPLLAEAGTAVTDADTPRWQTTDDVHWDRIVMIEPAGPQPVYDATVKGTHNFVADGIVAHNSLEQDADMVILLYREDAFEKESPRAGEADLILAKHRNGPTATVTVAFQGHYSRFIDMQQG